MQEYGASNQRLGGGKVVTCPSNSACKKRKARIIRDLLSGRKNLTLEGLSLCLDAPELASWEPSKLWHTKAPTKRQLSELAGHGVPSGLISCRGLATIVLNILASRKHRCMPSLKMVAYLYKHGVEGAELMTLTQASNQSMAISRLNELRPKP